MKTFLFQDQIEKAAKILMVECFIKITMKIF